MPRFLHVGCGQKPKTKTTPVLAGDDWEEVRLDIDPSGSPHIVASMTDMSVVPDGSMDALVAHHTLEHLYVHEVPVALAEFARVLAPDGFAIIAVPNLQAVAKQVMEGRLLEAAYVSPAGPITPHDMLYGLGRAVAAGHTYMAHRCGFTPKSLSDALEHAGFQQVVKRQSGFNLFAYARRTAMAQDEVVEWARTHFD
jgi:ubiquinone/menaquinone biosynthesis C-methylase UbiE